MDYQGPMREILFICSGNVGRSQMAEAFWNGLSKNYHASSAGTSVGEREGEHLHGYVLDAMRELNYDLSERVRKQLTQDMVRDAYRVVSMVDKETLSKYITDPSKVIFWGVADARGTSLEFHRNVRDQIKSLVEDLYRELDDAAA